MTAELLGTFTAGQAIPIGVAAKAALDVSLGAQLPEIQAKLAGMLLAQAQLTIHPPSIAASLELATALVANLQVAPPSASIDLSAVATIIAELQAIIAQLNVQLSLSASWSVLFGVGGVSVVRVDSALANVAAEADPLIRSLDSPAAPAHALMLVTTEDGAWNALEQLMRVS